MNDSNQPPPLPDRIRFNTTRMAAVFTLNYKAFASPSTWIVNAAVIAWVIYSGMTESEPMLLPIKIITACVTGLVALLLLIVLQVVVTWVTVTFARTHGVVCEHTLQIVPGGLEETTSVNVSVHKLPAVRGMKRVMGYWIVSLAQGPAWGFHQQDLLEGDADSFRASLSNRLVAG